MDRAAAEETTGASSPSPSPARRITAILFDAGVVTREQIEAGLERQRQTGLRIGETLVEMRAATEEDIGWALARQMGITFVDVRSDAIDRELVARFPANLLQRLEAVPLVSTGGRISIAISDPTDSDAIAEIARVARCPVDVSVATATAVRSVLAELLGPPSIGLTSRALRPAGTIAPVIWNRSAATFLAFHLDRALGEGATSLHLVADEATLHISRRINGMLVPVATEPARILHLLLDHLEVLGFPATRAGGPMLHTGQVTVPVGPRSLRVDASVLEHEQGLAVTLRWPEDTIPFTLETLGLNDHQLAAIHAVLARPAGLLLITGAIGCGASTTLSCLLREITAAGRSAYAFTAADPCWLEPPPGCILVKLPAGSLPNLWEEIVMSQDPDVVVLDDLRAREHTLLATLRAAAAHLVLARIDWEDSFALLEYLGHDPRLRSAAGASLSLLIGQRRMADSARPVCGLETPHRPATRVEFDVLTVNDTIREALSRGVGEAGLRAAAQAQRGAGLAGAGESNAGAHSAAASGPGAQP